MEDFFTGDKALADAQLLVKHVEQQLPTFTASGWCAVLNKGPHSLSFTPNEVILRDKVTRGHQVVAIVAIAADNKQEADGHSRWIFTPPQDSPNGSGRGLEGGAGRASVPDRRPVFRADTRA